MLLKRQPIVVAIDLEGTLISNAVSQFPRPGLYYFLEYCYKNFDRLVIFTLQVILIDDRELDKAIDNLKE